MIGFEIVVCIVFFVVLVIFGVVFLVFDIEVGIVFVGCNSVEGLGCGEIWIDLFNDVLVMGLV